MGMTNKALLDLYTDYLISSFGQTTGTGLSALLGGSISHDRIQRFLSKQEFTSADLWHFVKPHVRAVEQEGEQDGCLIEADKPQGQYVRVAGVPLEVGETGVVLLEGVDLPLLLCKQLFTNEDGGQIVK